MKEKNSIGFVLDRIGLVLIGLGCIGYSHGSRVFAQLHITLPFLDFPVFVGELLLVCCFLLLFIKHKTVGLKLNFQRNKGVVLFLFFYGTFVLVKALYGYFHHGPLALRNAALFYYPYFYWQRHIP